MKIAVDILGYENDIYEAYNACLEFQKNFKDVEFILVGNKNKISNSVFEIIHTEEFISQQDTVFDLRKKKNTSVEILVNLLKENKVDGILSACNTSVYIFLLYSKIGPIKTINKIGLMPCIPKANGIFNMIDVGGSLEVTPEDLYKFAILSNEYTKQYKPNPVIKVLNIATEEHKGNSLQIETNKLLKEDKTLNYKGFIESRELLDSDTDIVITDAYSGNIALKSLEGATKTLAKLISSEFKRPKNAFLGLLCKPIFKKILKRFDYKENAGAVVIGLEKNAVKTHGSADKQQFYSSLRYLREIILNNTINNIKNKISENYKNEE